MITSNQIKNNLRRINPQAKKVYFGLNKPQQHEQPLTETNNILRQPKKQLKMNFSINPSTETVKKMAKGYNYFGFEQIKGIDRVVDVNIGTNPTEAGIFQSGVLTGKKDILNNQYTKEIIKTNNAIEKEQEQKQQEAEQDEIIQQDVLLSFLTR